MEKNSKIGITIAAVVGLAALTFIGYNQRPEEKLQIEEPAVYSTMINDAIELHAYGYLAYRLDTECWGRVEGDKLEKMIEEQTKKKIPHLYISAELVVKQGFKGIEIEKTNQKFWASHKVTMSPESAYRLAKPYPIPKCRKKIHIDW